METWIVLLTNVLVPITVALISSGKLASKLEKKFSVSDLSKKIDSLEKKIDSLEKKSDSLEKKIDLNKAESKRTSILRFNGEIKRGIHHDEEEFNDCLGAIDYYEDYCRENKDYPNSKAVMAIANVKRVYKKAYQKNDF
jgi:hypothetical protein